MAETNENKYIDIKELAASLRGLKNQSSYKNDHANVLKKLHYNGITSTKQFDAILLKAIDEKFTGINKDIVSMSLGLMQGYEKGIRIGDRRENYLRHSDYIRDFYTKCKIPYDEAGSSQQKKYRNSLIDAEDERIIQLAEFLAKKVENGGFDEYIKDLSGYYDSVAETPILPEPEYAKEIKAEVNDDEDDMLPKSKGFEKRQEKDWGEQIAKELSKIKTILHNMVKILKVLTGAIIFFSIIRFWRTNSTNMGNSYMMPVAPLVENTLATEEPPIDNALLVEMETFSIDEDDKVVPIAPGYSRKLPVKNPSPPDADISTIKAESSAENIVWVEDGEIVASDDIPEDAPHDICITLSAKNHTEKICVKVVSFAIPDDSEGAVGGGRQSGY